MKKIIGLPCLIFLLLFSCPVMAEDKTAEKNNAAGDTVKEIKASIGKKVLGDQWYDRIDISGIIEIEANYNKTDFNDPVQNDEKTSDADLASVGVAMDAKFSDHVDGHVLFKYENDDVFLDEGFIKLSGAASFPAYLIAGRQYIPFGSFDTHFVSDPNTLLLGETNEGALVAGFRFNDGMIDILAGAFNGKIDKAGDHDEIDSFVAAICFQPVETFMVKASYTSNLASSDGFSDNVAAGSLKDLIDAWSIFASFQFLERCKITGEFVGALDAFQAGEIYDAADSLNRKPSAWNMELGITILENLEIAFRYGGSDDGGEDFLPKTQYGSVINWGLFEHTALALEYLHQEFENSIKDTDSYVLQLAVEF